MIDENVSPLAEKSPDGRPSPEEAWGLIPKDDESSCVWTIEMATAYAMVQSLIKCQRLLEARALFQRTYIEEVQIARSVKMPATWSVLLGNDHRAHAGVISVALRKNKKNISGISVLTGGL